MARADRRHVTLDRLQALVGVGADEIPEHGLDAPQRFAASFERGNRVVESGSTRIVGDCASLHAMLRHRAVEGRMVIFRLDVCEIRNLEGKICLAEGIGRHKSPAIDGGGIKQRRAARKQPFHCRTVVRVVPSVRLRRHEGPGHRLRYETMRHWITSFRLLTTMRMI